MAENGVKDAELKKRIKLLIQHYKMNDAAFAQSIQTGRSTLSACLNGSNGISKEIIFKIHEAYPDVSTDWLLYGDGAPFKNTGHTYALDFSPRETGLFPDDGEGAAEYSTHSGVKTAEKTALSSENKNVVSPNTPVVEKTKPENVRRVVKIMVYYSDNTFETYSLDR